MPKFCTNCGSPVDERTRFCTKCGSEIGPVQVVSPPSPTPSTVQAPPAAGGAGAPSVRSGSSGLKILLIVLGVFAGITVIGIGSCIYVGYRIKQKLEETVKVDKAGEPGQSVTINTPAGQIKLSDRTSEGNGSEIGGVPAYPESKPIEGGARMSFGGMGEISGQEYQTRDPVDKVVAFYKDKFNDRWIGRAHV